MKYKIQQFRSDYPDDDVCLDKIFALRYGDKPEWPGCHHRSKRHRKTYKDLVRYGYEHSKVQHGVGEYVSGSTTSTALRISGRS